MKENSQTHGKLQSSARVVYNRTTGDIVHVHQALWPPYREAPKAAAIDAEALRVAAEASKSSRDALDVLTVELETLETKGHYAVDVRKKALVRKPVSD